MAEIDPSIANEILDACNLYKAVRKQMITNLTFQAKLIFEVDKQFVRINLALDGTKLIETGERKSKWVRFRNWLRS